MSTFNGIVKEFPNIQIDYFRKHADRSTAAFFLSHVHSDHLLGLESVRSAFVYCSAATAHMLLNMEKYPHRINFAKGILERRVQTYRHLKSVLRILPLHAPTEIELNPKSTIRVTLFDANHCPGAVMFLIEGHGKAILYTGDVRAEPWWVNSLVQNPLLLPYSSGIKTLDCIYLDTTFATHAEPYRDFPTKAEGLKELIQKVEECPPDSVFYFRAWTLGYENVWVVLSSLLQSGIHVDEYASRLLNHQPFRGDAGFTEGPSLTGYQVGNYWYQGCLSQGTDVRIHSCEPGLPCHRNLSKQKNLVWITPIISRLKDGTEVRELGAGGGWGDLHSKSGLNLDGGASLEQMKAFMQLHLDNKTQMAAVEEALARAWKLRNFTLFLEGLEDILMGDEPALPLKDLKEALVDFSKGTEDVSKFKSLGRISNDQGNKTIHFPYSRHSSYNELRDLVGKFRPKDICPCTVDESCWTEDLSMESLFGDLCSEKVYFHDDMIRQEVERLQEQEDLEVGRKRKRQQGDSQETASQTSSEDDVEYLSARTQTGLERVADNGPNLAPIDHSSVMVGDISVESERLKDDIDKVKTVFHRANSNSNLIVIDDDSEGESINMSAFDGNLGNSVSPTHKDKRSETENDGAQVVTPVSKEETMARKTARIEAYAAAKQCLDGNDDTAWNWYPLRSAGRSHNDEEELEL